ncbi:MAG: hypothetical protein V1738_00545 [Patescibacteria group bacterium]
MEKATVKVSGLSKSIRTFIRREKARIRQTTANVQDRQRLINDLYARCGGSSVK